MDETIEDIDMEGLNADQQKVLAVVKNNDTEEGADLASDFAHLGSKFLFRIQNISMRVYRYLIMRTTVFIIIFSGQRQTSRNSELVER